MSRREAFASLYRGELAPVVREIDAWRAALLRKTLLAWGAVALVFTAIMLKSGPHLGYFLVMAGLGAYAYQHFSRDYRLAFKERLVGPLIACFNPDLSYRHDAGIVERDFTVSQLFREHVVTDFKSEDLVWGSIGETTIRFSEVEAKKIEQRGKHKNVTLIFKGLYFIADFNKHFRGETYVLPDTAERLLGSFGKKLQSFSGLYGEIVKLEDPEFERWFVTYSSDQIEARYILSSALMARITRFRLRHKRNIRLGFVRDTLYVALDYGRNLFEPRFFKSIDDPALFEEFWTDLAFITGIVSALALDTRIWTRE